MHLAKPHFLWLGYLLLVSHIFLSHLIGPASRRRLKNIPGNAQPVVWCLKDFAGKQQFQIQTSSKQGGLEPVSPTPCASDLTRRCLSQNRGGSSFTIKKNTSLVMYFLGVTQLYVHIWLILFNPLSSSSAIFFSTIHLSLIKILHHPQSCYLNLFSQFSHILVLPK